MNNFNKVLFSLVTIFTLDLCIQPAYSTTAREVIEVSEKKYIKPEHIKGLDTYGNPVDFYRREEYILRFKDRNGYFNVTKELYNKTQLGRQFTTEDNRLYFCRPKIDGCDSFK